MMRIAGPLTAWAGEVLGVPCGFGEFPDGPVAAMLRAAPCEPVVRAYASGGGVYRFCWEAYLRCRPLDDGERVAGMEGLCLLWDAVAAGGVPPVGGALWHSHDVTLAPCQYDLQDDGTATYQMAGEITWIERG